ncbi:hypothetical protein HA402_005447 [Bradysia odoriphaga]|nr:hypothetical protein HA402_005447 [Bradysia odoriphaga]
MDKVALAIPSILSAVDKMGLLNSAPANVTKIRDEVTKSIFDITNGLRDCISYLDTAIDNTKEPEKRREITAMKEKLIQFRNDLQSNHIVISKAYAEGGDNRAKAHYTMLELALLVEKIMAICF